MNMIWSLHHESLEYVGVLLLVEVVVVVVVGAGLHPLHVPGQRVQPLVDGGHLVPAEEPVPALVTGHQGGARLVLPRPLPRPLPPPLRLLGFLLLPSPQPHLGQLEGEPRAQHRHGDLPPPVLCGHHPP